MRWINYFVTDLHARGTEGIVGCEDLSTILANHSGAEAYHCAFDLNYNELRFEEDTGLADARGKRIYKYHAKQENPAWPRSSAEYDGIARPAFDYVWFDFDSKDGGIEALKDAKAFVEWAKCPYFSAYSGSKGFHVGIPLSALGLSPSKELPSILNKLSHKLKKTYPTIDTTVFNPNRKFRALGTRHPKTGLYKYQVSLDLSLPQIKVSAEQRGSLQIAQAPIVEPCSWFVELLKEAPLSKDSISLDEWRKYRQPEGSEAFKQCLFLQHAKQNAAGLTEPEWYSAASIVGRFKNGRAQFHEMSKAYSGYSSTETEEKLEQALQAAGPRTCQGVNSVWGKCHECPLFGRIKSPIVIMESDVIPTEASGFYDLILNEKTGETKRVPNYGDILLAFKREYPYKTIADMKTVYAFNTTHYEEKTPIEIKGFSEQKFVPAPQEKVRMEFLNKVLSNEIDKKSFFARGIENKINFKNGVLELNSKELLPHSAEYGFRGVLPYSFDKDALCPTFDWWISDVMLGDADLIKILQEFMGYVIRGGEYKYHKALWLAGTGRNGKSTFLSVLKALIGGDNYSTLSIKQIIQDKFSSASLDGKIANFSEETSPEELSDSGPFKNLTGDGELEAQKKYGDPYRFANRAKLIMTYNEVPLLKDLSPGMLSRPIIIPFKKDLTGEGAQDRSLKAKLLLELPGILNFALKGWERLEEQEDFTKSEKSLFELDEVRDASCSAAQWVKEFVEFLPLDNVEPIKPRALYNAYKAEVGQYAFGEQKFYRRIQAIQKVAERRRRVEKGTEYIALRLARQNEKEMHF